MNNKARMSQFFLILACAFLTAITNSHASLLNSISKKTSVACFDSTIKSAIQKIIIDSNTVNTDLDLIGFQADKCQFNAKHDVIECLDKNNQIVFTVELVKLESQPTYQNKKIYFFSFKTGNENISVIYDIEVTKFLNSQKCEVTKIESRTELP